jgi:hypothetical protein
VFEFEVGLITPGVETAEEVDDDDDDDDDTAGFCCCACCLASRAAFKASPSDDDGAAAAGNGLAVVVDDSFDIIDTFSGGFKSNVFGLKTAILASFSCTSKVFSGPLSGIFTLEAWTGLEVVADGVRMGTFIFTEGTENLSCKCMSVDFVVLTESFRPSLFNILFVETIAYDDDDDDDDGETVVVDPCCLASLAALIASPKADIFRKAME